MYKYKSKDFINYIYKDYIIEVYKSGIFITKSDSIALTLLASDHINFKEGPFEKEVLKVLFTTKEVHRNED